MSPFRAALCLLVLAAGPGFALPPNRDVLRNRKERRDLPAAAALSVQAQRAFSRVRISATEPRVGVPSFLWANPNAGQRALRNEGYSTERAAREYLVEHAELYRASAAQWAKADLWRLHEKAEGAIVAHFTQRIEGLPVFRDEMKVVLRHDLSLVALSGFLTPAVNVVARESRSERESLSSAYADLTGHPLGTLSAGVADGSGYHRYVSEDEGARFRVKSVWFPHPEGLEAARYVELNLLNAEVPAYFSYVVSASTGAVLYRHNLARHGTSYGYRVWADDTELHVPLDGPQGNDPSPLPSGEPDDTYAPPFAAPSLIRWEHGPISTNDPWLPANATRAQGNNVHAYGDIKSPDGFNPGDVVVTPSDAGVFDRVYDVSADPAVNSEQRMAAVTQLFYDVNFFHDWYYDFGFDEAAGNAQTKNFNRGGLESDPILAEGQDYSGRDNSDMYTPADGESPIMQMYIFDGAAAPTLLVNDAGIECGTAYYGPRAYDVSGQLAIARDGSNQPNLGCTQLVTNVMGKVALVDRGDCTFVRKTTGAQAAGALGLIVIDNEDAGVPLGLSGTFKATIPTVSVTKADGERLRAQLAQGPVTVSLSRPARTNRDGTIDNTIVAHEWGHYIQGRLIGDGAGFDSAQADALAEGWSDFHSLLMMVKESDLQVPSNANWNGVYAVGGYTEAATDPYAYYFGFRRMPYSTNLKKNALTFRHIQAGVPLPDDVDVAFGQDGLDNAEAHAAGEVWANVLWECYAALLRDPRYTFTQARDRMMQYLVTAYKVTPIDPSFLEARDALLAAVAASDEHDLGLFWAAFAKRGMGTMAKGPEKASEDNVPVVESDSTEFTYPTLGVEGGKEAKQCAVAPAGLGAWALVLIRRRRRAGAASSATTRTSSSV